MLKFADRHRFSDEPDNPGNPPGPGTFLETPCISYRPLDVEIVQILKSIRAIVQSILDPQLQEPTKSSSWNFTSIKAQPNAWANFFNIIDCGTSNLIDIVQLSFLAYGSYTLGNKELWNACYSKEFILKESNQEKQKKLKNIAVQASTIFQLQEQTLNEFRISYISYIASGIFLILGLAMSNANAIRSGFVSLIFGCGYGFYNIRNSKVVDQQIQSSASYLLPAIDELLHLQS